jgi:hypothetical protein
MLKKRECMIQDKVQIICPFCGRMIEVPMCKAVNGEEILCPSCQKIVKFGM